MNHPHPTSVGRKSRPIPQPSKWNHPALNAHEVRRVSVEALCDPRSVVKYLWGYTQSNLARERIALALKKCGHDRLVGTREDRERASQSEAMQAAQRAR